ncbi:ATP-binding protein [Arthrobacter psychrolactophilus]|uniref:ATP-binding protein n=1 Tax=Arthrobacter psychrolactophilus TaxID=92442 RepID=UPI002482E85D|nr:ATP-binding protein [Arthrobacter psychrolactophilus]
MPASPRPTVGVNSRGQLAGELAKPHSYKLLVVDEVGYIPFDQDSPNLAFNRWADAFGEAAILSAVIDRIIHHAEVIGLSDNSCRQGQTKPQIMEQ